MAESDRAGAAVLIVDDDAGFAACVQTLLEQAGYSTLVASTGEEALRIARQDAPPLCLVDIHLPGMNGYEVVSRLRDEFGHSVGLVLISGARTEPMDISSGLLAGADDYITKPFEPSELVARVGALRRRVGEAAGRMTARELNLTKREQEILQLLADGLDQKEIAETVSLSPKTVGTYLEHILAKLDVHSRAQAVAAAYREHLIR